jgi:CRISPR type III-A-associated protein Csm2
MGMHDAFKKAGIEAKGTSSSGYFDDKGCLRLEYVAKENVETLARKFDREGLNMHQLRRFFNYCREIERRLKSRQSTWEAERSNVFKLSAFAADAAGKRPAKIPISFREFLDRNVERIRTETDFVSGFMQHFEALVGFSAMFMKEERSR